MIPYRLTRLESTNENLRSNDIEGGAPEKPEVGKPFVFYAPPLESGDIRVVRTSEVKSVHWHPDGDVCKFTTKNSTYLLSLM